jgi:pilus assembly protein CpaC
MIRKTLAGYLIAALVAVTGLAAVPARAADAGYMQVASAAELSGQVMRLGVGKSVVIDLPEDATDILVSNPAIADAVIRTSRRIYIIGVAVGETNIFLFGDGNRQLAQFEVVVGRDVVGLQSLLDRMLPTSAIEVEGVNEGIVISGSVRSAQEAAQAETLAAQFVGGGTVVNLLQISGSDQVNIRVVIAELQRNALKEFGIDAEALLEQGSVAISGEGLLGGFSNIGGGSDSVSVLVNMLNEQGVMRTLAEPNLTAISGGNAEFLVGGEIPITVGRDEQGIPIVDFKEYGVKLNFTPVVISGGRISLEIETEISEIDESVRIGVDGPPGLRTRRAQTTVELPSGGSIAIGGLLQDNISQSVTGVPGLMDLPVLGTLFRSSSFQRSQSELVILVTPYTVDPVATSALQRPDQNFTPASDTQQIFLNQVNRIYRVPGTPAPGAYYGHYGYVFD